MKEFCCAVLVVFGLGSISSFAEQYVSCKDGNTGESIYSTENNRLNTWRNCRNISLGNIPAGPRHRLLKNLESWRTFHREWNKYVDAALAAGMPPGCQYIICFDKEQCARDLQALGPECVEWYSRRK